MQGLIENIGLKQDLLTAIALSILMFGRLVFAIFFTPFFGGRQVPARVKMGVAGVLAILLYPGLSKTLPAPLPLDAATIFMLFMKECFVGLLIGLVISMIFFGIQAAGQFIDNQQGLSIAAIFNPSLGAQASLSATFLFQLSVVVFFVLGGHRIYISGLFRSFEILPLVSYPGFHGHWDDPSLQLMAHITGNVLLVALQLSAPVAVSMFIAEVVLGIANRVAPQMDVQFLSYSLKSMTALLVILSGIELIILQTTRLFEKHLTWVEELIRMLPGP